MKRLLWILAMVALALGSRMGGAPSAAAQYPIPCGGTCVVTGCTVACPICGGGTDLETGGTCRKR